MNKSKSQQSQWMGISPLKLYALVGVAILLLGCQSSRVVFVGEGDLIRIGPDVVGHVYYLKNGQWEKSGNKVKLPEGWYAGSLQKE